MKTFFQGAGHLVRLGLAALFVLLVFLAVRHTLVPESFGRYGHYRAASLDEIAARPPVFAGHQTCATCHVDVDEAKNKGPHAIVACEGCHGPAGKHAQDVSSQKPPRPDPARLCPVCHEADNAKKKTFPQVVSKEHFDGAACGTCHNPHQPRFW
jgi:hypothetical protein